jgi:hypothetical protein
MNSVNEEECRKEVIFSAILVFMNKEIIRGCIQKFPDWPPGARTANGI